LLLVCIVVRELYYSSLNASCAMDMWSPSGTCTSPDVL